MRKSLQLALAVLVLVLLVGTRPAQAVGAFAGLINGGGVISPALPGDGTPTLGSSYSFSGYITGVTVGSPFVSANGTDLIGSLTLGYGDVSLSSPFRAHGVFIRVGADVTVAIADPAGPAVGHGHFVFTPNPVQVGGPVGAYTLSGYGWGAGV